MFARRRATILDVRAKDLYICASILLVGGSFDIQPKSDFKPMANVFVFCEVPPGCRMYWRFGRKHTDGACSIPTTLRVTSRKRAATFRISFVPTSRIEAQMCKP